MAAPEVEPRRVINLMEALKSSLARIEGEGNLPGGAPPREGEPGGERRAS